MKKSKPIKLFVPTSIIKVLDQHLVESPPNFHYNKENFYYIFHKIQAGSLFDKRIIEKNDGYVDISLQKLTSVISNNASRYIKYLKNYDLIECDNKYSPGVKAKGYRIRNNHNLDCNYILIEPETTLFKKLSKKIRNKKSNYNKQEDFLNQMRYEFMELDFDYDKALEWVEKVPDQAKRVSYTISLNLLEDKRFRFFSRNKTNQRLDTNLTNLKSDLREFIIGNYIIIDLKNSQPFFLCFLLKYLLEKEIKIDKQINSNNKNMTHPLCSVFEFKDIVKVFGFKYLKKISLNRKKVNFSIFTNLSAFESSVINGSLYDDFICEFKENISRDDVKEVIFKVMYSQNGKKGFIPWKNEKYVFASVYPDIYEVIKILKEKDHRQFAIFLQKMESFIFIDCIAKQLVENGIIPLTIHDSVIIKSKDQVKALQIIKNLFKNNFGVIPSFHIKEDSGNCLPITNQNEAKTSIKTAKAKGKLKISREPMEKLSEIQSTTIKQAKPIIQQIDEDVGNNKKIADYNTPSSEELSKLFDKKLKIPVIGLGVIQQTL